MEVPQEGPRVSPWLWSESKIIYIIEGVMDMVNKLKNNQR